MAKPKIEIMAISEFKATCLAVLERVRRTGIPVVVTRRGIPVAEIVAPPLLPTDPAWIGSMRGSATIEGDILAPAAEAEEWEVLGS